MVAVSVPSNDIVVAAPGVGGCPPSLTVYTALCRSDIHAIRGPLAPYSYNVPLLLVPSYNSRGWFRVRPRKVSPSWLERVFRL